MVQKMVANMVPLFVKTILYLENVSIYTVEAKAID